MLDIKFIRENPKEFDEIIAKRGLEPLSDKILKMDAVKRSEITELQSLLKLKNDSAKLIGSIKDKSSQEFKDALAEANKIKAQTLELENKLNCEDELEIFLGTLPNLLSKEVPNGATEDSNVEIRKWGNIKNFGFEVKQHFDLGEALGLMDFEQTAKFAGSRMVSLKGDLSRMERALAAFMLDNHTKNYGYTEMSPPFIVWDKAMYGVGQLPKFAEDSYATTDGYRLIPTSEVSLTNMVAERIVDEEELPLRYTAFTPCFRSEAGSAGKDTRGMIRLHQFSKVELVSIVKEEDSDQELERLTGAAEEILKKLELPYRVVLKCAGDTGFSATKSYDLEVWLPGQNTYREISSCSNCKDFQARRMKARYRGKNDKETKFLHTLNGSGLAVGRTIVAILENYQNQDGTITVPKALVPYMGGIEKIGA